MSILGIVGAAVIAVFFAGIRIVRPTHRGLIERLGKYRSFAEAGFHWIIPVIDRMFQVNVTELPGNVPPGAGVRMAGLLFVQPLQAW